MFGLVLGVGYAFPRIAIELSPVRFWIGFTAAKSHFHLFLGPLSIMLQVDIPEKADG